MTIDTSRAVEIEASPLKQFGLIVISVVMAALCGAIVLGGFAKVQPGSFREFVCYVGLVFFPLCGLLLLWRAVTMRGPTVTITPEGIRDVRVAAEFIPWRAIHNISVWKHRRQRFIVLAVDPAVEAGLDLTRMARWSRNGNRALGADGLFIGAGELKIGFDDLLATCLAFAQASQSAADTART
jgi:hypothetical protein